MGRNLNPLEVGLDILPDEGSRSVYASGVGVSFADNPQRGRFIVRGVVVGGPKHMLHRPVEIKMTYAESAELQRDLERVLDQYPDTGTMHEVHTGGSDA